MAEASMEESDRASRSRRMFVATIRSERSGEQSIIVRNLSRSGIGGRLRNGTLQAGEPISIILNGQPHEAKVRWVRKDCFGASLAHEIDPKSFNFRNRKWECTDRPWGGHVFDQFKPMMDGRRPGLKVR